MDFRHQHLENHSQQDHAYICRSRCQVADKLEITCMIAADPTHGVICARQANFQMTWAPDALLSPSL